MSRQPSVRGARAAAPASAPFARALPVRTLSRGRPTSIDISPEPEEMVAIARFLDLEALHGLRFRGEVVPVGAEAWRIEGDLRAKVVQRCVVTLEPVEATIREAIARDYVPEAEYRSPAAIDVDPEAADEPDPFDTVIDPGQLAIESLALSLDPYPRKPGVPRAKYTATPPGAEPLTDETLKPFAKLALLKEKRESEGG